MDYEQKYKDALEKLQNLHDDYDTVSTLIDIKEELENIFPELKESEDEKIRKELIEHIKANCESDFILFQKFSPDDVIAWLEKQGDKDKLIKELGKYKVKYTQEVLSQQLEKQGEQKSTWAEEDEKCWLGIIDEIEANKSNAPDYDIETYDRFLSWLNSIKQRMAE